VEETILPERRYRKSEFWVSEYACITFPRLVTIPTRVDGRRVRWQNCEQWLQGWRASRNSAVH